MLQYREGRANLLFNALGNVIGISYNGRQRRFVTPLEFSSWQYEGSDSVGAFETGDVPVLLNSVGDVVGFKLRDGREQLFIQPVLSANLRTTLIPEIGPVPIFSRDKSDLGVVAGSGVAHLTDHQGVLRPVRSLEAMFWGARRVENLCRYSENLGATLADSWSPINGCTVAIPGTSQLAGPDGEQSAWAITRAATTVNSVLRSQNAYVLRAVPHTFSVWLRAAAETTAELRIYISGGATLVTKIVNVTTTWQRFAITGTPDGTSAYVYSIAAGDWTSGPSVTVYAAYPQLEEIYGTSNMAPSEYVARDAYPTSVYYQGAAVDGVKYFESEKGNTVNATTGIVTASAGAGLTTCKGLATFASVQGFFLNGATLSSATGSQLTVSTGAAAAPDGTTTAIRLTEDTTSNTHFVSQTLTGTNTFDGKLGCFTVYAKFTGAGAGRSWIRLAILDIDGSTTKSCFFNIETGTVGTASHGVGAVEALANGWYRCIWSAIPLGTGASDAVARIFLSTDGATLTYLGASRTVDIWGPQFTSALSAAGAEKSLAVPHFFTAAAANNLPGAMIAYEVQGLLGYTDFAVASNYVPYYVPGQANKGNYSAITYVRTESVMQNTQSVGTYDWDRTGLTIRPNNTPSSVHASKFGWDFYLGEINSEFFWKPSTEYRRGQIAIPTSTLPDNRGGSPTKMFTCVVGGTSGASEPTWVNTFTAVPDTASNLTPDGGVRWQVNEDNGIAGNWEPYLGCHKVPGNGFMESARYTWFITKDDYGSFENGVPFEKQTTRLFENGKRTVLRKLPKFLYLGQMGTNKGIPGVLGTASSSETMANYTAFHNNLRVYDAVLDPTTVAQL